MDASWLKAFDGLDLGMMTAIAIVAFILEYSKVVNNFWAILTPLTLGAFWGIIQGQWQGWGSMPMMFKGAMMNGAFASVTARGMNHIIAAYFTTPVPADAEGLTTPAIPGKPEGH